MSNLAKQANFFIVKVAGENAGTYITADASKCQRDDRDFFVATNKDYPTRESALKVARELAAKTPDNRYYVVKSVSGVMTTAPQIDERTYE